MMAGLLDVQRHGGIVVLRFPADVDASNADIVAAEAQATVSGEVTALLVDLRATRYLDSAGIDGLFRLADRLRERRQGLHLVLPEDAPLMRLLRLVAIPEVLPVHEDLETGLAAARGGEWHPAQLH